jgi:peroxiredoxin
MENDNRFTNERLSQLREGEEFQPNAARARILIQARMGKDDARPHHWMLKGAAVAALLALVLVMHAPRVSAMNSGRPIVSVHEMFLGLHRALYAHYTAALRIFRGPTEEAPDFVLTDANGRETRLSAYRGKVVLLNFWATWCAPCKEEVPWFVELQNTYGKDLAVLGVSMDEDGWSSVRPFLDQHGVNYPIMLQSSTLPALYRDVKRLPTTFLVDREGKIVGEHTTLASYALYEDWVKKAF